MPVRAAGATHVHLFGAVELHGPSTDGLTAEATWTDRVDDLSLPKCAGPADQATAFRTHVRPYEDVALLADADAEAVLPTVGKIGAHNARHEFGDTRHRRVDYRFRASTRFREYFRPELLAAGGNSLDDGQSVIGPVVQISVPSSARPAAPIVHSVIPLFRWSDATEPEQPMSRRHGRRAGVRIYLERPWFSSGNGELLGVLLARRRRRQLRPARGRSVRFPVRQQVGRGSDMEGAASVPTRNVGAAVRRPAAQRGASTTASTRPPVTPPCSCRW